MGSKKGPETPKIDIGPRTTTAFPGGIGDLSTEQAAILRGRQAGKGLVDPNFVQRSTSPFVQARETRFQDIERPQLSSALSARGINRSSIAGDLLSRQSQGKEQDIAQLLAQAFMQNEAQKQALQAQAIGQGQGLIGLEAGQQQAGTRAALGVGQLQQQTAIARSQQPTLGQQLLQGALGIGTALATGGTGGAIAGGLASIFGGGKKAPAFPSTPKAPGNVSLLGFLKK